MDGIMMTVQEQAKTPISVSHRVHIRLSLARVNVAFATTGCCRSPLSCFLFLMSAYWRCLFTCGGLYSW